MGKLYILWTDFTIFVIFYIYTNLCTYALIVYFTYQLFYLLLPISYFTPVANFQQQR